MSTFDLADYATAASHGFDLAAAERSLRNASTPDEQPLTSYRAYEDDAFAGRPARQPRPAARETVEAAAADDLAGLVAQVPLGKAPKITGTQLQAVLAFGAGAAVLLAEDNSTVVVEDFDVDDPDAVPVALWSLVKTKCDPEEDEEGNKPPAVKPAALAQSLTVSLRRGHARCALNPVAA